MDPSHDEPKTTADEQKSDPQTPYTAVVYEFELIHVADDEPLKGIKYFGQAVRVGTVESVANARWQEETSQSKRENKSIGLLAALSKFGRSAFRTGVLLSNVGPRSIVQKWADQQEQHFIAVNGGPLKCMDERLHQTLNLDHGGKYGLSFECMDALRTVSWRTFSSELKLFVECSQTAYVPYSFVSGSGYKLGARVSGVKGGELWKGHPDEEQRVAWLNSLPGWNWGGWTQEALSSLSRGIKKAYHSKPQSKRDEHSLNVRKANHRPSAITKRSDEKTRWWSEKQQAQLDAAAPDVHKVLQVSITKRRKSAVREKEQLDSLRTIPGWELSSQSDLPKARTAGIIGFRTREEKDCQLKLALEERRRKEMEQMTPDEKERYKRKVEREKRKTNRKIKQLDALRKVRGFECAKMKDIPIARKMGKLPNID